MRSNSEVWHLSGLDSVEHIQIEPDVGLKIHAYRNRQYTQGPQGEGSKKKKEDDKKKKSKGGKRATEATSAKPLA